MSDALQRICAAKRDHVRSCRRRHPLAALSAEAGRTSPPRGFVRALEEARAAGAYGLIAEIKRASPSQGLIRRDFDPAVLARAYLRGGATCLSVLTDAPFFQGADEHLTRAREAVDIPILRKDFMLDPYQVVESRAIGADCILLVLAALDDGRAKELEAAAIEHGMDVMLEVHDADELDRALGLDSRLIGINNRDLKSLGVDLGTTEALAPRVPADRIVVSESGLHSADDLARMSRIGVTCFLVGESLMREPDVEAATRALLAPTAPLSAIAGA